MDGLGFLLPTYSVRAGGGVFLKWTKKWGNCPRADLSQGTVVLQLPTPNPPAIYLLPNCVFSQYLKPQSCYRSPPFNRIPMLTSAPCWWQGEGATVAAVAAVAVMSILRKERDPSPLPLTLTQQPRGSVLCRLWAGALASSGLPTAHGGSPSCPAQPAGTKTV